MIENEWKNERKITKIKMNRTRSTRSLNMILGYETFGLCVEVMTTINAVMKTHSSDLHVRIIINSFAVIFTCLHCFCSSPEIE